jgi:hypothetical protein
MCVGLDRAGCRIAPASAHRRTCSLSLTLSLFCADTAYQDAWRARVDGNIMDAHTLLPLVHALRQLVDDAALVCAYTARTSRSRAVTPQPGSAAHVPPPSAASHSATQSAFGFTVGSHSVGERPQRQPDSGGLESGVGASPARARSPTPPFVPMSLPSASYSPGKPTAPLSQGIAAITPGLRAPYPPSGPASLSMFDSTPAVPPLSFSYEAGASLQQSLFTPGAAGASQIGGGAVDGSGGSVVSGPLSRPVTPAPRDPREVQAEARRIVGQFFDSLSRTSL